jgi:hypothetical protein
VGGNFCANCGHPIELKRIDGRYLLREVGDFFFANKGMLYTISRVFLYPGKSVKQFLDEDRYRFVKPITFLIITSLFYTLINYLFNFAAEDYYRQYEALEDTTPSLIIKWMMIDYPGYSGIITSLFVSFWIKLFFRKSGYNIFEIFILLCFVSGITTLLVSVAAIIQGITHLQIIQTVSYLGIGYTVWAIGQFFDRKRAVSYIKAFLSFILGTLILGFVIGVVGALIDMF